MISLSLVALLRPENMRQRAGKKKSSAEEKIHHGIYFSSRHPRLRADAKINETVCPAVCPPQLFGLVSAVFLTMDSNWMRRIAL